MLLGLEPHPAGFIPERMERLFLGDLQELLGASGAGLLSLCYLSSLIERYLTAREGIADLGRVLERRTGLDRLLGLSHRRAGRPGDRSGVVDARRHYRAAVGGQFLHARELVEEPARRLGAQKIRLEVRVGLLEHLDCLDD